MSLVLAVPDNGSFDPDLERRRRRIAGAADRSATEIEHLKSTCADRLRRVLREHGRIVGEQTHDDA